MGQASSSRMRAVGAVLVAVLLGLVPAGCGGGSGSSSQLPTAGHLIKTGGAGAPPEQQSAGPDAAYHPTGRIVADDHFRPEINGFRFENYGGEVYSLGFYKDTTKQIGHAVTPYAVEDKGGGKFAVLIYDNNHPGIPRAISFDRNADSWSYDAARNPNDPTWHFAGDAQTLTMS